MDNWNAKIDENIAGLVGAVWGPDSRHILTFSDFNLRVTIWSLMEEKVVGFIKNPKLNPPKGLSIT